MDLVNAGRERRGAKMARLALAVALISMAACSGDDQAIRIGVNDWPPCELWYVAEAQGFFGKLDVDIVRFSTWTDNMKSLPLGDIDVTHSSYFNALYYRDKGNGGRIVLKSDTIVGGDGLVIGARVKDVADLRGRKVAVETATDEHFLLYKALERYGLRESDITIVSLPSVEAAKAFAAGTVDACFTYEPYLSEAAAAAGGTAVYTTKDIPDTMIDVLVASEALIRDRPADVRRLVQAYLKAQAWVKDHPDEAFAVMAARERMKPEDFGPFYGNFTFFDARQNAETFASEGFSATIGNMSDFLLSHGLIKSRIEPGEMVWGDAIR